MGFHLRCWGNYLLLKFADGVYLVLLMGLLEGYFVPLHSFFLTPDSFEQKVILQFFMHIVEMHYMQQAIRKGKFHQFTGFASPLALVLLSHLPTWACSISHLFYFCFFLLQLFFLFLDIPRFLTPFLLSFSGTTISVSIWFANAAKNASQLSSPVKVWVWTDVTFNLWEFSPSK